MCEQGVRWASSSASGNLSCFELSRFKLSGAKELAQDLAEDMVGVVVQLDPRMGQTQRVNRRTGQGQAPDVESRESRVLAGALVDTTLRKCRVYGVGGVSQSAA